MNLKKSVVAFMAGLFLLCTFLLAFTYKSSHAVQTGDEQISSEELYEEIQSLKRDLRALSSEMRKQQAVVSINRHRINTVESEGSASADNAEDEPLSLKEEIEQSNKRFQRYVDNVEQLMESEARDFSWAGESESELASTLELPIMQGTQMNNVECKSTVCRIEAVHVNLDARETFLHQLDRNTNSFKDSRTMSPAPEKLPDGGIVSILYISKSGHTLPLNTHK